MRLVIQKAQQASVTVEDRVMGQISHGFMVLVGVTHSDTKQDAEYCARKVANMRLFEDAEGKTNLSLADVGGAVLSISQFTLYANTRKGNRPSFVNAAEPQQAEDLYEYFNEQLRQYDVEIATGEFGAHMAIDFINDGPMTILIDSQNKDL
ncbi:D-tyrosyl-tRNA(Tyr) deacylase [Aerococcaceae bacterium DSM 111020]|nr:D-tyrosyl-tRNA(Tyr) deacylase [Aerococcaceae bacterium DSM 111020]